ncbi:putative F-box protein At1g70380 [Lolium perenne]|uniref:putative F-box protein At1g70380 n=1 Tax=Lolium perenne TaxID=4522 RepID=UPI003A99F13C
MRRRCAPPLESADTVSEILLKLPTRDVARCCCVSRLWRNIVADPSFRCLHAMAETNHLSAASEALLVTKTCEHGRPDEASFFSVSSSRPMPYRVKIPSKYNLSNVCNGLLCFAVDQADAPAFVCNPVTGQTAMLPKAPPPVGIPGSSCNHHFALGFSPSTREHKLFRFSFSYIGMHNVSQSVYTLGGAGGGWRQRSYHTQCPLLRTSSPVFVQGKLYLVTTGQAHVAQRRNPDGLLEVDVTTEAHRTFPLPFRADQYHWAWDPLVNTFEMRGRLGLAVEILTGDETEIRKLQFWVLSTPPSDEQLDNHDGKLCWDLCYSFYVGDTYYFKQPRSAWFDGREMTLCYRDTHAVFKHGTRGRTPQPSPAADCPQCDCRHQLPPTPSNCRWNFYGGYRPSLLSPLTLAPPPSSWDGEEERQEFEHAMVLTMRNITHTLS